MKDEMAFLFNNSNEHQLSHSLQAEPVSIGCEAWIDGSRFCSTEKSVHHAARTSSPSSLTKSFADLRKKLHRSSTEGLD